jgi:hypothetical protein
VLRRHLPDWQPAGVVHTRELAEQTWPDLSNYDLDHSSSPEPGRGVLREAHRIVLLLDTVLHDISQPRPAGPATGPTGEVCRPRCQAGRCDRRAARDGKG